MATRPKLPAPSPLAIGLLVAGGVAIGVAGFLLKNAVAALDSINPDTATAHGFSTGALGAGVVAILAAGVLTVLGKEARHWVAIGSGAVVGIATGQFFFGTIEPSFGPAEDGSGGGWSGDFGLSLFVALAALVVGINARFLANRAWGTYVSNAGIALGGTQYLYVAASVMAEMDDLAAAAKEAWTPDPVYVPGLGLLVVAAAVVAVASWLRRST